MERKTGNQLVCGKRKCRNALQAGSDFGRYHASSAAKLAQEVPDSIGSATALKPDRAWRIVAGPNLDAISFRFATVPDGPNGQGKGGEYERNEAKNKAAIKSANEAEIEANGNFADPEWRAVISADGVTCLVTRWKEAKTQFAVPQSTDDTIPDFLQRRPFSEPQRLAA
jgi:hypothetical protein